MKRLALSLAQPALLIDSMEGGNDGVSSHEGSQNVRCAC